MSRRSALTSFPEAVKAPEVALAVALALAYAVYMNYTYIEAGHFRVTERYEDLRTSRFKMTAPLVDLGYAYIVLAMFLAVTTANDRLVVVNVLTAAVGFVLSLTVADARFKALEHPPTNDSIAFAVARKLGNVTTTLKMAPKPFYALGTLELLLGFFLLFDLFM
jgi:hypothetical protein